jgi:RNA 2',3'-cyclic 3'-phosphodiesterase
VRLFVGIALAREAQQALESFVCDFRVAYPRLRWSLPPQWHVTLQFLGETDESRYLCTVQQLRKIHAHPVEIRLAQPGFFERAGVFHVAVQPTLSLISLHDQTEQALIPCGFEPEERAYSSHITLARKKGRGRSPDFDQLQQGVPKHAEVKLSSFLAGEFLLYQSFTEPAGPRYEVRDRFPLM